MHSKIYKVLFPAFMLLSSGISQQLFAATEEHPAGEAVAGHEAATQEEETGKFNPGDFMFDHIKDAHDWHLMSFGHTHVTIPLPVILISKNSGLHVFMSSKFKHGHASYKGFHLETSGENKGKILEADGTKPFDISITKNVAAMLCSIVIILLIFLNVGKA